MLDLAAGIMLESAPERALVGRYISSLVVQIRQQYGCTRLNHTFERVQARTTRWFDNLRVYPESVIPMHLLHVHAYEYLHTCRVL